MERTLKDSRHYIVVGGPEHLEWFAEEQSCAVQYFWTVPRDAKPDDLAFVYLTAPVSRIVGKLLIVGETFFNEAEFNNVHTQKKWMAEVKCVAGYKQTPMLSIASLRALFPDWRWLTYPRSIAEIPSSIITPLLELTGKNLMPYWK